MFRDQTDTVVSKAQASRKEHKARFRVENPCTYDDMKIVQVGHAKSTTDSVPKAMLASLGDFASMSFYKQFMANAIAPGKDGLGLVPDTYIRAKDNSMLSELTVALGLASHPLMGRDVDIQQLARKKYAKALSLTNKALGDPVERLKDETLMTIIMLALFELITGSTPSSIKAWSAHVNGSINLLVLRGEKQFHSRTGLAMFAHMKNRILISCVQRSAPVPESLLRLNQLFKPENGEELRASQMGDITAQLCAVQSEGYNNIITDGSELLRRLNEVDKQLLDWLARLPDNYKPQLFFAADDECVYNGFYYVYETRYIAWMFNNFHVIRIILYQWIVGTYFTFFEPSTVATQIELAQNQIREDSAEICATIPFVMGEVNNLSGQKQPANLYGLSSLGWILFPIISGEANPRKMRQWCFTQLVKITETSGMQQAKTLAEMARRDVKLAEWMENDDNDGDEFPSGPVTGFCSFEVPSRQKVRRPADDL